jgi:exocyst complex component 4
MAGRHYLREQDAEEPEDFIVALTSQVFFSTYYVLS